MEQNFNLVIISPEKILLTEKVSSVTIPSFEGEMTILSDHIPLITFLRPGIAKVYGAKEKKYFLEEGTVEFSNNTLIILSSTTIVSFLIASLNVSIRYIKFCLIYVDTFGTFKDNINNTNTLKKIFI